MMDSLNQPAFLYSVITIGSFIIFTIGLAGVLIKKNLFKIFLSLSIAEGSLFLFFIGSHFQLGKIAPIAGEGMWEFGAQMVDPVPQAMILTTIVIAIAVLALALSFVVRYYKLTQNMQVDKMDELGEDR
ncbi:MAG: sodium:proton antiporter [Campylobacterota bacterium]|nr:sodium:proton antiporter [Campylobacterota bacterium]